jgi:hypothetical protein
MSEFNKKIKEAENWFNKFKEGVETYPSAYAIYDEFCKYNALINNIPEPENKLKTNIEDKLLEPISLFVDALGPALNINKVDVEFSGATAASGSAFVLNEIQNYTPIENDWLTGYRNDAFSMVEKIQKEKDSINFISEKLNYLYKPLGKEFDELAESYNRYLGTIDYASSFGIKMRNVIEHFKGVCNKCAVIDKFGYFKELKDTLTWNKISESVAVNGKGSKYDNQFSKNSSIFTDIHSSLSQDAKDYTVDDIAKLPKTFIKTIQYLESSIKLVDLNKIKNAL